MQLNQQNMWHIDNNTITGLFTKSVYRNWPKVMLTNLENNHYIFITFPTTCFDFNWNTIL